MQRACPLGYPPARSKARELEKPSVFPFQTVLSQDIEFSCEHDTKIRRLFANAPTINRQERKQLTKMSDTLSVCRRPRVIAFFPYNHDKLKVCRTSVRVLWNLRFE